MTTVHADATPTLDLSPLDEILRRIVASWAPKQVWLFGSRARGTATPESDWDLLAVVPDSIDESDIDPVSSWKLAKNSGIRAEIFPCRVADFDEDRQTPNTLAFEAAMRGVLVYER